MVTIETKKDGKSIRIEQAAAVDIALPPVQRAFAAADKIKELMSKETISLDEALERPEVLEAARAADISGPEPTLASTDAAGESDPLFHRYLLSILNQRRDSFDDLTIDEMQDLMRHPRFSSLRVISFEAFCEQVQG